MYYIIEDRLIFSYDFPPKSLEVLSNETSLAFI